VKALRRYGLIAALVLMVAAFSLATPTFLTLKSLIVDHFAILSLASLAMTLVVAAGGIDLSVGTAIDFASLAYIMVLAHDVGPGAAIVAAFTAAAAFIAAASPHSTAAGAASAVSLAVAVTIAASVSTAGVTIMAMAAAREMPSASATA